LYGNGLYVFVNRKAYFHLCTIRFSISQNRFNHFLQNKGFALPAFIALGTGIKSPVITSKINPYIGIFDGIRGWLRIFLTSSNTDLNKP